MKTGGGYSAWAPKSKISLGQGKKGSPEKYCMVIDPFMEYLPSSRTVSSRSVLTRRYMCLGVCLSL